MTNFLDAIGADGFSSPKLVSGGIGDKVKDGGKSESSEKSSFANALSDAIREVDDLGDAAKDQADALSRGEPVELHDLMISVNKSEVAFNLMLEVRNKLLDAWQTISRSAV